MEVPGRADLTTQTVNTEEILCQPCFGDGENIPAEAFCETCKEHFCSSCLKFHRKQAITKNHVIKSKDEMPKVQVQTDQCSELCETHNTEVVKFFCEQHDEVGCGDCMVLKHKACSVQLVKDVSGNHGKNKAIDDIRGTIGQLQKTVDIQKGELRENIKTGKEMKKKVIEEIQALRTEVNNYLDHAEAKLIKEVEELNAKEISNQGALQVELEHIENELKALQAILNQNSDKINNLFVAAKLARRKLQIQQESTSRIAAESSVNMFTLDPSAEFVTLKLKNSPLGTLSFHSKKLSRQTEKNTVQACFAKKLNAAAPTYDKSQCSLTGIAKVSRDEIVVTDYNNETIKILNCSDNKVTSVYIPDASPWDVCKVDSESVAVTIPSTGNILFMKTKNGLSPSHSLQVRKSCRGIDYGKNVFAVSFTDPPSVQIFTLNGKIMHAVSNTCTQFHFPCHVALSKDIKNVFVSDMDAKCVYELTIDGKIVATIKCDFFHYPGGLAQTRDGTICVGNSQGNCHKMIFIAPLTRDITPIPLKRMKKPCSVLVCEEENKLYLCEEFSSAGSDEVSVFDLK